MPGLGRIEHIIWHCSATPNGTEFTATDIDKWHRQRGFREIGYHYVIGINGEIWPGRKIEYNNFEVGAHCRGKNHNSLGVCIIGGVDDNKKATYTPNGLWLSTEQRKSIHILYDFLSALAPGARHSGHREWAAKECPCFEISEVIKGFQLTEPNTTPTWFGETKPTTTYTPNFTQPEETPTDDNDPQFDDDGR